MSFISLFGRVIPKSVIYSLLNLSICLSRNVFLKYLAISVRLIAAIDKIFPKIVCHEETPPNCTILRQLRFENFILADETLQKVYEFLKLVYQLIIIYVEN